MSCAPRQSKETADQRFKQSLLDATTRGSLKKLTEDGRNIYPIFSPGDSIIYFQRLLITSATDTFAYHPEDLVKPYGINILNGELYTLEGDYEFPIAKSIDPAKLPRQMDEKTLWGIWSPDSSKVAFETVYSTEGGVHYIYLQQGDSIRQLSYGATSCYLDRFSNRGRYLTAIYGNGPTWILLFDLEKDKIYKINRGSEPDSMVDFMTIFSSDDSMMAFVRSEKKFRWGDDYFGDIWLLRL